MMRKVKAKQLRELINTFIALKKSSCIDCKNLGMGGMPIVETLQAYLSEQERESPIGEYIWLTPNAIRWTTFVSVATNREIFDIDAELI